MVHQAADRIGVLVIRAFLEPGPARKLLVQLLEVRPPGPDRVIGIVGSASEASQLVDDWLGALEREGSVGAGTAAPTPEGER